MKVRPLADRVLVKTEKTESKTASGIIIPDTAQEKTQIAVVVAVGDDKEKIKVKAGERVMYDKYAGTSVKIDGEEHLILKAADIIAVIDWYDWIFITALQSIINNLIRKLSLTQTYIVVSFKLNASNAVVFRQSL